MANEPHIWNYVLRPAVLSTLLAADASTYRENLGLEIGVDVLAYDANVAAIDQGLATTDSVVFDGISVTGNIDTNGNNLELGGGSITSDTGTITVGDNINVTGIIQTTISDAYAATTGNQAGFTGVNFVGRRSNGEYQITFEDSTGSNSVSIRRLNADNSMDFKVNGVSKLNVSSSAIDTVGNDLELGGGSITSDTGTVNISNPVTVSASGTNYFQLDASNASAIVLREIGDLSNMRTLLTRSITDDSFLINHIVSGSSVSQIKINNSGIVNFNNTIDTQGNNIELGGGSITSDTGTINVSDTLDMGTYAITSSDGSIAVSDHIVLATDQMLRITGGTSDPGTASAGSIFYRTDLQELRLHDGSSWGAASGWVGTATSALDMDGYRVSNVDDVVDHHGTSLASKAMWQTVRRQAGKTWTARSAAEANEWYSVCWSPELSLFCAVAASGTNRVMTSPDGITWTARSASEGNFWYSVCWSPELSLFCAVATSGTNRVMTSPDGITWTARSAAEANQWRGVCWSPELSLFCAVAISGTNRVMTSPDGITWTARSATEANAWNNVCWSPELSLFTAVSSDGTNRVMTSPDGITWTARSAAEANQWRGVCWSPELSLFCAVATSGTNRVMTSPDGITWTARSAAEANQWRGVCWSPELSLFCAVAASGTNRVMTSPDGITWTERSASEENFWYSVCWSTKLGTFCSLSYDGTNRVMTSTYEAPVSLGDVGTNGLAANIDGTDYTLALHDPFVLPSYAVASLPSAGTAGRMAYCTDETGGAIPVFDDGSDWRRVSDRSVAA